MLRTRTFRTKLLAILCVPVAALVGITAFAGSARLSDARDAGRFQDRVAVVRAALVLDDALQREQAASADVTHPGDNHDTIVERRAATDTAADAYRAAVSAAGDARTPAFDIATERIRRNLTAL